MLIRILILLAISFSGKAQDVYKTPSGAKYHRADCRMIKNVSEKITITKALELGLEPCKICKPFAVSNRNNFVSSNKAAGEGESVQCKGITKAGTRCKHMTRIANGYCAQHNPDKR